MQKSVTYKFESVVVIAVFMSEKKCGNLRLSFGSSYFKNLKSVSINTIEEQLYKEETILKRIVFIFEYDEILYANTLQRPPGTHLQ